MYEFCDDKLDYNIEITSYNDFCYKYWKILEIVIQGWYDIFRIYYIDNEWIK